MKKYQYIASWDDQTLTRVGEPVVVLGDANVSQVEVTMPSNFLLDPTKAECRMYFLLPGEKESDFETLETATQDENGDYHVTWTIKHAHTQKGGRLAFSLTLIGDDAQWDSRTSIIPVYESRYQPESEEAEEPYTGRLTALEGSMASIRGEFTEVQDDFEELKETATLGTPIPKSLASEMVEGGVYLYTGTEPGYTAGHVYYYVDGTLTDGGVYGGTAVDATLTISGQAADAKVTGDKIAEIKEDLSAVNANVRSLKNGERMTIEWTSGGWLNTAGTTVDVSSITANESWRYSITPAAEDDIFILYATGGISPRAWCFVDSSYNVLSVSASNATCSGTRVIAPANTAYAIIQDNSFTEIDSYITYGIIEDVKSVESEMTDFTASLDIVSDLISKDVKTAIFTLLMNAAFVNDNDRSTEYQLLRDWSLTEPSAKGGVFYHIGETTFSGSDSGIVTDLVPFNFDKDFTITVDFISNTTGRRVFGSLKAVNGNTYGFALDAFKVICDGTSNAFAHYGDHHHRVRMVFRHTKNSGTIQVKSRSTGTGITYDESFSYTPNSNATGYLCIGRTQDGNKQFIGTIYDFTLYSGVWTDAMSTEYVEG